jgi:hypothetical protein
VDTFFYPLDEILFDVLTPIGVIHGVVTVRLAILEVEYGVRIAGVLVGHFFFNCPCGDVDDPVLLMGRGIMAGATSERLVVYQVGVFGGMDQIVMFGGTREVFLAVDDGLRRQTIWLPCCLGY